MEPPNRRRSAIGVVHREGKFLVIQRADSIRAGGKFCFPGGGIEEGETARDAIRREMQEELGILAEPVAEIWQSVTSWNVHLIWWAVRIPGDVELQPNPEEVQQTVWMTLDEMQNEPRMLQSNRGFLNAIRSGSIRFED